MFLSVLQYSMLVELRGKKDMFQNAWRIWGKSGGALRSIAELRSIEGTGDVSLGRACLCGRAASVPGARCMGTLRRWGSWNQARGGRNGRRFCAGPGLILMEGRVVQGVSARRRNFLLGRNVSSARYVPREARTCPELADRESDGLARLQHNRALRRVFSFPHVDCNGTVMLRCRNMRS